MFANYLKSSVLGQPSERAVAKLPWYTTTACTPASDYDDFLSANYEYDHFVMMNHDEYLIIVIMIKHDES